MRRTLALAAAVIVAMAVGRLITDHVPLAEVVPDPFVRSASVGHQASLRYADVTVTGVRSARYLQSGDRVQAGGTFLVVDVRFVVKLEPMTFGSVYLEDTDGRRYALTRRGGCTGTPTHGSTGVPYYAMYCFDLPHRALEGARLTMSKGDFKFGGGQARDDLAEVDLGIGRADADKLWASRVTYSGSTGGFSPVDKSPLKEG